MDNQYLETWQAPNGTLVIAAHISDSGASYTAEKESKRQSPFIPVVREILAESLKDRVEIVMGQSTIADSHWRHLRPVDPHQRHIDEIRERIGDPLKSIRSHREG